MTGFDLDAYEAWQLRPHDVLPDERPGDVERDEAAMQRAVWRDLAGGGGAHGE